MSYFPSCQAPPSISRKEGYFTTTPQVLAEGTVKYVFHCYATGWPEPSFTWLKDGKKINNGDALKSYVLTKRPGGLDLDILNLRRNEHAGIYTCVARNMFGEQQRNITLFVGS